MVGEGVLQLPKKKRKKAILRHYGRIEEGELRLEERKKGLFFFCPERGTKERKQQQRRMGKIEGNKSRMGEKKKKEENPPSKDVSYLSAKEGGSFLSAPFAVIYRQA